MGKYALNLITEQDGINRVEPRIYHKSLISDIRQKFGNQRTIVNGVLQMRIGTIIPNDYCSSPIKTIGVIPNAAAVESLVLPATK